MNLNTLPKDVLYYMALDMDVADIISLCKGSKELNEKLCKNRALWINRLNRDFPDWINKKVPPFLFTDDDDKTPYGYGDKEKENLPQLYQILLLDRNFNGWRRLPEEEKKDFQNMYKTFLNIKNVKYTTLPLHNIISEYYISKLEMIYPDTNFLEVYQYKRGRLSTYTYLGEMFCEDVMDTIKRLKENYNYTYIDGNPFIQANYLKMHIDNIYPSYRALLNHSLTHQPSLSVIKYCIDKGVEITSKMIEELDYMEKFPYCKSDRSYLEAKELMEKHLKK